MNIGLGLTICLPIKMLNLLSLILAVLPQTSRFNHHYQYISERAEPWTKASIYLTIISPRLPSYGDQVLIHSLHFSSHISLPYNSRFCFQSSNWYLLPISIISCCLTAFNFTFLLTCFSHHNLDHPPGLFPCDQCSNFYR